MKWSECQTGDLAPNPRHGHALVQSPGCNPYIFGGYDTKVAYNDTWSFDFGTNQWIYQELASASCPDPRYFHAAVSHAPGKFVVFGGYFVEGATEVFYDDVWEFNEETITWEQQMPTSMSGRYPAARKNHSMVQFNENAILMFGGQGENGRFFNDTWILNVMSWEWTEIPSATYIPAPRSGQSMFIVSGTNKALMYGGEGPDDYYSDLWEYSIDGRAWTELQASGKLPRARIGQSFVLLGNSAFMFGGYSDTYMNDVWELDLRVLAWTQHNIPPPVPLARFYHSMIGMDDRLVLFGGMGTLDDDETPVCFNDILELDWRAQVSLPIIYPNPGGTYIEKHTITIKSSTPDAIIYYTTDGSDPTQEGSILFEKAFINDKLGVTVVKAVAYKENMYPSDVSENSFTVIEKPSVGGNVLPSPRRSSISSPRTSLSMESGTNLARPASSSSIKGTPSSGAETTIPTCNGSSMPSAPPTPSHPTTLPPTPPSNGSRSSPIVQNDGGEKHRFECAQRRQMLLIKHLAVICDDCLDVGLLGLAATAPAVAQAPPGVCVLCGQTVKGEGRIRTLMQDTMTQQLHSAR